MLRVALTGGIASGKTAVSDRLRAYGAVVLDADVLARDVVEPGTVGLEAVVQRFGSSVLTPNDTLDRVALGRIVFVDAVARSDLERIAHPWVRARAAELEQQVPPDATVVHVIPLLVETGQADHFDVVVVVDLSPEVQRDRLRRRNSLSEDEAQARLAAQASREDRLRVADYVVDNSGPESELDAQVHKLWRRLRTWPEDRTDQAEESSKTVRAQT